MWDNFQKALEKRVNKTNTVKDDKYFIIKTSEKVLISFFGKISQEYINVSDYQEGILVLNFSNSVWRSEFKLNENKIINKINNQLQEELIQKITLI